MSDLRPPASNSQWFCAQIGAREHYAVARTLHKKKQLAALYTDFWAGSVVRQVAGGRLRSLAARFHPELGGENESENGSEKSKVRVRPAVVRSWNWRSLGWELILRQQKTGQDGEGKGLYDGFIEVGRRFATCVRDDLKRRKHLPPDSFFFAYDTGALEALAWCREHKVKCILNQMDPSRVEVDLVRAEEKQWPGWTSQAIQVPEAYFQRREREWALADRVVVNSDFSRQALIQQGVPAEKLVVVPLCYEVETHGSEVESQRLEVKTLNAQSSITSLRVLFLGQVILRKGIQYLLAAAKLLEKENIHFDIVGPVGISADAIADAPRNVTFHGRTDRAQAAAWYERSHLFVLPTLSDGFALTQLEAMAHGLPVVTTPCCGEVVSDGQDGFIVPPRDVTALVRTFQRYLVEPELLRSQSAAALLKARQFTLKRLAENLTRLEEELKKS